MSLNMHLAAAAFGIAMLVSSPAEAQTETASGVAFFERVEIGGLDIAVANVFYDDRCARSDLCFRRNSMAISVIMFTDEGLREVVLTLGEPASVPGGTLTLTNVGAPPKESGAIPLKEYRLELEYVPADATNRREGALIPNPRRLPLGSDRSL
ncbi:MAG: hypothetical protein AAF697_06240 [Pseudomonadota bacterium]